MMNDDEIKFMYGPDALITRSAAFTFIHLDRPSNELADTRTRDFDPDRYFETDCPMCKLLRDQAVIVFDEDTDDHESEAQS